MILRNRVLFAILALLFSWSCSDTTTEAPETVSLSGTILNADDGSPVPGALVSAVRSSDNAKLEETRTNSQGMFSLQGLPKQKIDLSVMASGFEPVLVEAYDPENGGGNVEGLEMALMSLDSGTCCSGQLKVTVKNGENSPLAGVEVRVWKQGNVLRTGTTNAQGVVEFDGLCRGEYGVDLMKEGYRTKEFGFVINENCDPVEKVQTMELAPCCTGVVFLTVKDNSGNPISGAKVQLRQGSKELEVAYTDGDGKAAFDGLCAGSYHFRISKDGYTVREPEFSIGEDCGSVEVTSVLEVKAQPCCSGVLNLTVTGPQGPVQGAVVKVWRNGAVVRQLSTDANGQVVFDSLCAGAYGVDVTKEGLGAKEFGFTIGEDCGPVTKTVELAGQVCCSGVFTLIVRDQNGNPVEGAKVLIKKGGTAITDPRTGSDGKIVVDGLCKAEYTYRVSKDGYTVAEGSFAINENCDPVTKEASITGICCNGVFSVVVRNQNGDPIEGATVVIKKGGTAVADPRTNANGQAGADGLCAGNYTFRISKEGHGVVEGEFAINENCDPVTREVTLQEVCCSGVLTVTVKDSVGTVIQGAAVKLWKGGSVMETVTTNASGQATFDGLCKGEYGVSVHKEGYAAREFSFAIGADCGPVSETVILNP